MATKTAPKVDAPAKAKEPELFPAIASGLDDNGFRWEEVNILGLVYRFREVSVPESDAAYDASQNPDGTFNSRLNQRMELVSSIVSPTVTLDDIDRWSVRKLRAMIWVADRINTLSPADAGGNA
jgi:hypothetical protein